MFYIHLRVSFFLLSLLVRFAPSFLLLSLCVRDSILLLAVLKLVVPGSLFFIVGFSVLFQSKLLFPAFLIAENRLYNFFVGNCTVKQI